MNKQKFQGILSNYQQISDDDRLELHRLVKEYPYSQILHTLVAKANIDAKTAIATQTLNFAAMYATDRQLLKSILKPEITYKKEVDSPVSSQPAAPKQTIQSKKQVKITVDSAQYSNAGDNLRDEFWQHLNNLKASKANYLEWLDKTQDQDDEEPKPKKKEVTKNSLPKTSIAVAKKKEATTTKPKVTAVKKTDSVSKAKVSKPKKEPVKAVTKTSPTKEVGTSSSKQSDDPQPKLVKPKLEEQIEIIDKFIDKVPSISTKKVTVVSQSQEDLSVPSTQFGDDLVSENLAVILVGQGKVEKAIDMYKKLIWKFPQKKAYFAAQIEELTK